MTRARKFLIVPALALAAMAQPAPAHAASFGWFSWLSRLGVVAYCNPQGFCVEKGER